MEEKCYGLNMQAICDHKRRFLSIDIGYPASTLEYLSFGSSTICKQLESPGFLANGLTIYGDNAYVNREYTLHDSTVQSCFVGNKIWVQLVSLTIKNKY